MPTVRSKWIRSVVSGKAAGFALLMLATLVSYLPSINGGLIWDDNYLVKENPFFKSPIFILEVFKHHLFLNRPAMYYRPLQNISYMFDYWVWNGDTVGYHLSNILFHTTSAFLLLLLLRKLLPVILGHFFTSPCEDKTGGKVAIISLAVALVWVVHPIHNAAVAYISGRADSLASVFALGAWLLCLRADRLNVKMWRSMTYFLAAVLCMLALCSKEIAITWMGLFVFHRLFFDADGARWKKLGSVGAPAAILICYAVLRSAVNDSMPSGSTATPPLDARFLLMLRALGDYAGLIFFPARLHMERSVSMPGVYESASAWQRGIGFEYLSLVGTATLLAFACLCLIKAQGQVLRIFGAGWFMIGFLPISNLFPLNAQVAEHWIYMPSIGFLLFVSGCVLALPEKIHKPAVWVVAAFALTLSARTAIRSDDWRDAETFYRRSMEASNATDRLELNLALISMNRGDFSNAEKILRGTLSRYPDFPAARTNLGICLAKQGKAAEAEHWLSKSANPQAVAATGSWPAYLHLAEMRIGQNLAQDALRVLDEGIARFPDVWELTARKAQIFQERNEVDSSLAVIQSYAGPPLVAS